MGLFLTSRRDVNDPIGGPAGVPPSFYNDVDEVLSDLTMYRGSIERNGNKWTLIPFEGDGEEIYRDAVRLDYDANASLTDVTTPAAWNIAVGMNYVTVGNGATANLSTAYDGTDNGNKFYWVKLASTGGAFAATIEKGSSFPDPPGDQDVTAPEVNAYVRLWEVQASATKVTGILRHNSPLSTFS